MSTAIVIVDHGSRRPESHRMLNEVALRLGGRFRQQYPIVEPAHMELAQPLGIDDPIPDVRAKRVGHPLSHDLARDQNVGTLRCGGATPAAKSA